jgi:hypothetical protein
MDAGTHDLTIWGLFQQADVVVKAGEASWKDIKDASGKAVLN